MDANQWYNTTPIKVFQICEVCWQGFLFSPLPLVLHFIALNCPNFYAVIEPEMAQNPMQMFATQAVPILAILSSSLDKLFVAFGAIFLQSKVLFLNIVQIKKFLSDC